MPDIGPIFAANSWIEILITVTHISFDVFGVLCICAQLIDKDKLATISGVIALIAAFICATCNVLQYAILTS